MHKTRLALHANNLLNKHYRAAVDEMPGIGRSYVVSFATRL